MVYGCQAYVEARGRILDEIQDKRIEKPLGFGENKGNKPIIKFRDIYL